MKVVINDCFGGFRISDKGYEWLIENKNWTLTELNKDGELLNKKADVIVVVNDNNHSFQSNYFANHNIDEPEFRINKDIIEMIETLGIEASGKFSKLKVVEIPDNVEWEIGDYDGEETIIEKHRSWR